MKPTKRWTAIGIFALLLALVGLNFSWGNSLAQTVPTRRPTQTATSIAPPTIAPTQPPAATATAAIQPTQPPVPSATAVGAPTETPAPSSSTATATPQAAITSIPDTLAITAQYFMPGSGAIQVLMQNAPWGGVSFDQGWCNEGYAILTVLPLTSEYSKNQPVTIVRPLLDVLMVEKERLIKEEGCATHDNILGIKEYARFVLGNTGVFHPIFFLNAQELAQANDKTNPLQIFWYSPDQHSWLVCPNPKIEPMKNQAARFMCDTAQVGLFALGTVSAKP